MFMADVRQDINYAALMYLRNVASDEHIEGE
jgi:hypothetical protein